MNQINKIRGVAMLLVIGIVTTLFVVVVGASYGIYKYRESEAEKNVLKQQLEVQNNAQNKEQNEQQVNLEEVDIEKTEKEIVAQEKETLSEPVVIKEKEFVYVPTQATTMTDAERQAEIDSAVSKALAEQTKNPELEVTNVEDGVPNTFGTELISVVDTRQSAYPDGYGGTYGSYELEIEIEAKGGDVFIPMSTNDTLATGLIGFYYTIVGDNFGGKQDSEVSTCGSTWNGYCKISEGKTRNVTITIWIYPSEGKDGNYAIRFDRIKYFLNDDEREFLVNKQTDSINLYY